jgi:hypothetical protein
MNGGKRIAALFPAKRDVIAFRFASRLKINQQD